MDYSPPSSPAGALHCETDDNKNSGCCQPYYRENGRSCVGVYHRGAVGVGSGPGFGVIVEAEW